MAGLVRELLARETGLTMGIRAFSEAQQTEIERALETGPRATLDRRPSIGKSRLSARVAARAPRGLDRRGRRWR